jgi:hypothetical protein
MLYYHIGDNRLLVHDVIVLECGGNTVQCTFIYICSFIRQINVSRINCHISKDIITVCTATVRFSTWTCAAYFTKRGVFCKFHGDTECWTVHVLMNGDTLSDVVYTKSSLSKYCNKFVNIDSILYSIVHLLHFLT